MAVRGCLGGVLVLIGLAAFGISRCSNAPPRVLTEEERQAELRGRACRAVQMRVEDLLKAPASAKFDSCYSDVLIVKDKRGDSYTVSGIVDAPNSLGVLLRARYTGTATHSGDDLDRGWTASAKILKR